MKHFPPDLYFNEHGMDRKENVQTYCRDKANSVQRAMEGVYIMVISCPEAPSWHALVHQEQRTSESFLWFLIALDGDFQRVDTKLFLH